VQQAVQVSQQIPYPLLEPVEHFWAAEYPVAQPVVLFSFRHPLAHAPVASVHPVVHPAETPVPVLQNQPSPGCGEPSLKQSNRGGR